MTRWGTDKEIGDTLNKIGRIYMLWGQYPKALEYFEHALGLSKKVGDSGV